MDLIWYFVISICANILLFTFVFIFMKDAWINLKSRFMKNPVKVNILTNAKKRMIHLMNVSDNKFKIGDNTYVIDDENMIYEGRIASYFYLEGKSEPIKINSDKGGINSKYLTDLLLAAELHGANNFIRDLVKFKWVIIGVLVLAGGILYVAYKTNELQVSINSLKVLVSALKSANLAG